MTGPVPLGGIHHAAYRCRDAEETRRYGNHPELLVQGHGDFHPKNVFIGQDSQENRDTLFAAAIDFESSLCLPPAFDVGCFLAQFQIQLSRAPATNVTITYDTADGTATAPGDYKAKFPGTVVFAPGQISKTVDVLVNSDTALGSDRSFNLDVAVIAGSPVEEL